MSSDERQPGWSRPIAPTGRPCPHGSKLGGDEVPTEGHQRQGGQYHPDRVHGGNGNRRTTGMLPIALVENQSSDLWNVDRVSDPATHVIDGRQSTFNPTSLHWSRDTEGASWRAFPTSPRGKVIASQPDRITLPSGTKLRTAPGRRWRAPRGAVERTGQLDHPGSGA